MVRPNRYTNYRKEKLENNFYLKKKVEREEKVRENQNSIQNKSFIDNKNEDNSDNSENEKDIQDIFKKPIINFSKFKKKKEI